jgi:DNA-binding transcriptional LysR family regulator
LLNIIDQFKLKYPAVNFDLLFTNQILDLVSERIDVAVRIGRLKDSTMISRISGGIDFILVTSKKYLESLSTTISVNDLVDLKTIAFVSGTQTVQWNLKSAKERRTVKVKPHLKFDHFVAMREMIALGHGIGFVPRYICEKGIANGELIHILKSWGSDLEPVQVLVPHQKEMPPLIRTFSDFLTRELSTKFS